MKLLNLGCGRRFHTDWTNVDFVSTGENVIAHNLLDGIPFGNATFDVVYHSHVLEHFTKADAVRFVGECYRVLKPRGIIRVAVPDLEQIVRCYIEQLEGALKGNPVAQANYRWIMLELYDQTVRNESGGAMAAYLFQDEMENETFVYSRVGEEGRNMRRQYLKHKEEQGEGNASQTAAKATGPPLAKRTSVIHAFKNKFKSWLFREDVQRIRQKEKVLRNEQAFLEIGHFRRGGEIHQWMYDRYSLGALLKQHGFVNVEVKDAFSSTIPAWSTYQLEVKDGVVLKPDSLFMEALK